jgi:FkbM family methyltransferase
MGWRITTFKHGLKMIYNSLFEKPVPSSFYDNKTLLPGIRNKQYNVEKSEGFFHINGNGIQVKLRTESSDVDVFDEIFVLDVYRTAVRLIEANALTIHSVVDLGSNIGLATVYFHAVFPDATYVCVEADKENWELMTENLQMITNRQLFNKAVWSESKALYINNGFRDGMEWSKSVSCSSFNSVSAVEGVTITELLDQSGLHEIGLLKVDIEGSEFEVFMNGDIGFLDNTKTLVMEIHPESGNMEDLVSRVRSAGFVVFENESILFGINLKYLR